jgi:anti-sigma B factor antagonist
MQFYYHEVQNEVLVIAADGGLNKQTADQFVEEIIALIDGGIRKIIIDCDKLTYISSFGIGVLLRMNKKAKASGGEVKIANVHKKIMDVINLMRLGKLFSIYPDVNRALLEFRPKDA